MSEIPWYKSPQQLVAAATIISMILAFFYLREKAMWEVSNKLHVLELRGDSAILKVDARFERGENFISSLRDQVNFLERKVDRLETKLADREKQSP